jgi:transcriptional regulator GlxA family with amidase domain
LVASARSVNQNWSEYEQQHFRKQAFNCRILLYDDVNLLEFAGATQVFAFAGGFDAIWLAADKSPVMTSEGVEVLPQYAFGDDHPPIEVAADKVLAGWNTQTLHL